MITSKINGKEFVQIKVPGTNPFWMAKKQELDGNGERFTNITEEDALRDLKEKYGKKAYIWQDIVCLQMRNYAEEKLGTKWKNVKDTEKLFGVSDLEEDEWVSCCKGITGIRWYDGASAGAFTVALSSAPSRSSSDIGFRCCLPCESEKSYTITPEVPEREGPPPKQLKEQLAAVQHEIWSHWMRYMFGKCHVGMTYEDGSYDNDVPDGTMVIPKELAERWGRQAHTDYKDLTEKEKASDREQVDKFWGLFEKEMKKPVRESLKITSESELVWENINTLKRCMNTNQTCIKSWGAKVVELEQQLRRTSDSAECLEMGNKEDVDWLAELDKRTNSHKEGIKMLGKKVKEMEKEIEENAHIRNVSAMRIYSRIEKHNERIKKLEDFRYGVLDEMLADGVILERKVEKLENILGKPSRLPTMMDAEKHHEVRKK